MGLFDKVNQAISFLVSTLLPLALGAYWLFSSIQKLKKEGLVRGAYLSIVSLLLLGFPFLGLGLFPVWLGGFTSRHIFTDFMTPTIIRWVFIYMIFCPLIFRITKEGGKRRAFFSALTHITILALGWLLGKWIGIIFISIPIFAIFYTILYNLAQVILPASSPDDVQEQKNKFQALSWYIWGNQYPFWLVNDIATREVEARIDGDYFKGYGKPGVVWTHSHQVVGISSGIEFTQVAGPGIIFTEQYDRPVAVVDLRTQLRTAELKTITKDGISITAILFISFKIDQDKWPAWEQWEREQRHNVLRTSPILRDGLTLDQQTGSFPYSTARIHAALSTLSVEQGNNNEGSQSSLTHWDEIVLQRAIDEARLVLSDRKLNQLWVPEKDDLGASALDEIGDEIKKRLALHLQAFGVKLFGARIVNFSLETESPIQQRQIESWKIRWKQRIASTITDGNARSNVIMEEANTYAKAAFLETFTQSLNKARAIHPNLPKHVVALHYIAALENLLVKVPGDSKTQLQELNTLKEILLTKR